MILKRVQLHNFRNISSRVFDISSKLTIILGENARGKTNILESIHCIINGVGFRESKEEELLLMGSSETQLDGLFDKNSNTNHFRILLKKEHTGLISKQFFVEKTRKGHAHYTSEQTKCVLFAPEQIDIITGSPDIRREYFNKLISTFDIVYKKHLINYEQALRKRNKLLEHSRSVESLKEELSFWDVYLEKEATFITEKRQTYTGFLNSHKKLDGREFHIEYAKNEFTQERLKEKKELELRIRRTLIGPQKDDWIISLKNKDVDKKNIQKYGSRSEQRLGVFWLKMNEIHFMEEEINIHPILLLDDVFSEFDHENKERIVLLIEMYQTVMTTTEEELVKEIQKKNKESVIIKV
ncbi:MAG: DNA replication and repair protein RecF [Candidatus Roizmanbacteria bacterium]|nr:DNA replication and repair protein RecF [Candidatus Roizmanbacteria bacterium]